MKETIRIPMWDKMQFFCERIADHQIRIILNFNEKLNKDILKDAIKNTLENNLIVFANYEERKNKAFWNYSEMDINKVYSFHECNDLANVKKKILLSQLNSLTGPQLAVSLIRSKEDSLVLNFNHTITDAAGVKDFLYELAKSYTELSLLLKKSGKTKKHIQARSLKLISKKLSLKEKISILQTMLKNKRISTTFDKIVDVDNIQNPDFKTHTFSPAEFKVLKEYGKFQGATINDMLLAVYYLALKRLCRNSNKTNRLTYSADLRNYLKNNEYDILSNYSAIHNIDIDNATDEFDEILKDISTQTNRRKEKRYNLADFPMMALLFKFFSYRKCKKILYNEFDKIKSGKSNVAPSISNVGIIDDKRINFGTIIPSQAYVLGGINHPSLLQLVASTYKNRLTISFGSYFSDKNKIFITKLLSEFEQIITTELLTNTVN